MTGLEWTQPSSGEPLLTWQDAKAHCDANRLGGHADWRLPTSNELVSLIDPYASSRAASGIIVAPERYWSATPRLDPAYAWVVNVKCVRSTKPRCFRERFANLGQNEVFDAAFGLTWQRVASPERMTFMAADQYCRTLGARYRLPSPRELYTIVDLTRELPAIDTNVFPDSLSEEYSTFAHPSMNKYAVDFTYGSIVQKRGPDYTPYPVRCVKQGLGY